MTATLINIAKSASATLSSVSKHYIRNSSGGTVFYGWLFWLTITDATQITNVAKRNTTVTNVPKD